VNPDHFTWIAGVARMPNPKTTRLLLPAACWALLNCIAMSGFAARPLSAPFTVSHWDVDSGLPPGPCSAILQTRNGYLWFGTEEGLGRFDGVNCAVFDRRNTPALKASRISVLYEDRRGTLWIGTEGGGLTVLQEGEFRAFTREDGLRNDQISALLEDRGGTMWVGTDGGGLFRFNGTNFARYEVAGDVSDRFVVGLAFEPDGTLLVAYRDGLRRIQGGKIEAYRARDLGVDDIASILCETNGLTWIGSKNDARCFRRGEFKQAVTNLATRNVQTLRSGPDGELWIGTAFGLYRWDNHRLSRYTIAEGLSGNVISFLWIDHEGSVWVGNNASGVDQIKRTKFQVYAPRQGLSHEVATCIYQDSRGGMWVGTEQGLNHFHNGRITHYTTNSGLSWNLVFTVCEDRDGAMWIGTLRGLNRFAEGKFTRFGTRDGLPSNTIWCSFRDRASNLWIGTRNGLVRYQPDTGGFQKFDYDNAGLSHNDVRSIAEDNDGRLWIGTSYGLNRLDGDRFEAFRTAAPDRTFKVVLALHADRDGALWIGTMDKGLFRHKDGKFAVFTSQDGLYDDLIHQILEDDKANLWLTCNRGIFRVSKKELNDFADGKRQKIQCVVFDRADGLPSAQCNGTIQPAGWKSRDGRLWFPTLKGVAVIDPANISRNAYPPQVQIEKLLLDGSKAPMLAALRVQPGVERVDIHYTGLSFVSPQQVRFKYRLQGLDDDWVEAKDERVAHYTHLPAGDYRFHVRAANNDGVWNETGALLAFTVLPPWWGTWWFVTSSILAFAGAVGGGARVHVVRKYRRRMAELERQHALERERARIARDMHDGLGASLVKISLLGEIAEGEMDDANTLRTHIGKMVSTARESVRDMDEIVWAVNPKNDSIENLATYLCQFAREHFEVAGIQLHLDVPTELPVGLLSAETRYQLFLAAKEVMTNIVKHAHATEASLTFRADASRLSVIIRDNGCGLPAEPPNRQGHGRKNIQERLAALGGAAECSSKSGKGTEFVLSLPLRHH
jgi:ligand-binding sensor domain-containing protein/signal transduction histidine kinase